VNQQGLLFVVSGPSGAGKTTILKTVLKELSDIEFSVSMTTRPKRAHEVHGVDYFFVTEEEFQQAIDRGEFIEHAFHYEHRYGTTKGYVMTRVQAGVDMLLDLDVKGALNILATDMDPICIFITPPSFRDLSDRLKKRATEDPQSIGTRLENAKWELSHIDRFRYLIINHTIEASAQDLKSIIRAEKLKVTRRTDYVERYKFL